MKTLGIVAVGVYSQGVPNIFMASMYRAHCAVIFAIAQLSCWTQERVPMAKNVLLLLLGFLLPDFQSTKTFVSQAIVVKLHTQIDDNIVHNRTVSNFRLKF